MAQSGQIASSTDVDAKASFLRAVSAALNGGIFSALTLGKVRGCDDLKSGAATLVLIRGRPQVQLLLRYRRRDETKNYTYDDFAPALDALLGHDCHSATLQTTGEDVTIDFNRKGEPRLTRRRANREAAEPHLHDRRKDYPVAPDRPYLAALDVSDRDGRVKPTMQGKYRQINRFIEIVRGLLDEAAFEPSQPLTILDIGSGKGYLTFALYDDLRSARAAPCHVTGVEVRDELVAICAELASDLAFSNLSFTKAEARTVQSSADVVLALHACDTATDDAILIGIEARARLIVTAPCCQHEIAPQLDTGRGGLRGLLRYPLLRQRQADLVTDAARALLLEASGYKVKIIEFVATEHTAKNILIAAIKSQSADREGAKLQYRELKSITGFATQRLAAALGFD